MELHQLKCFIETVRTGSMNKASNILHVSQPALSISIRNLEDELAAPLFNRNGKKISLTATGELIVPYVEKILQYENEIKITSANRDKETKTVRLLVLAGSAVIPGIITAYHSMFPQIDFNVIQENSKGSEQPDLIIKARTESSKLNENEIVILKEKILVAVPKDHELSNRDTITSKELQKYELIGLNRNLAMRTIEDEYCKRDGINLCHSIECDNPSILRDLITRGIGPALVAEKTWMFQFQSHVKLIPIVDPYWTREIILEKTNFRNNSDVLEQFKNFLLKEFSKL